MTMLLRQAHDGSHLTLRDFVQDRWALLLSHPNDFRMPEGTPEGFVGRVRAELDAERVCIVSTQLTTSWLDRLDQSSVFVMLERTSGRVISLAERALRIHLNAMTRPYAVIVDSSLHVRATIHYRRSAAATQCVRELLNVVRTLRHAPALDRNHHQASARSHSDLAGWPVGWLAIPSPTPAST